MRCAVHPDQEAVAICKACGAAVCPRCRSVIGGITYCYSCTVAGRYRQSLATTQVSEPLPPPVPADSQTRRLYRVGIVGLLLFGVSLHLVWAFGLASSQVATPTFALANVLLTASFSFLAIGMALSGAAFLGLERHFSIGQGFAAAASSFLFAWWPITADLLKYTGLVLSSPSLSFLFRPGPLYPAYVALHGFGLAMMVVTLFLWARALYAARQPSHQSSVILNAMVLLVIAMLLAVFLLPLNLASRPVYFFFFTVVNLFTFFVLALLLEPATLLIALLFHRVARGIPEKPAKPKVRSQSTGKPDAYPLQWIRRS